MSKRQETDGDEFLYWQRDQTEGEYGFRWDMVDLLRDEAGNCAIMVCQQNDFRLRRALQERERTLDEIASLIQRFLPPRAALTDTEQAT